MNKNKNTSENTQDIKENNNLTWDELAELKLTEKSSKESVKYANEATAIQNQVFRLGFTMGAEWQREQLLQEEIIEEAARAAHKNDLDNGFVAHSWGQNSEIDNSYRSNAKAAIQAILRVK